MLRTIYRDPERYVNQPAVSFSGVYFTGDSARKDKDGYFWIIGRVDDVIKVSGYRLGTAEIESAVSHLRRRGRRHRHAHELTPSTPMSCRAPELAKDFENELSSMWPTS